MGDRFRRFKDRFPLAAVGVEVFSIVLGVLVALGVNEWRQVRTDAELADAALTRIRQEVARNAEVMADRHPYHAVALDSLQSHSSGFDRDVGMEDVNAARLGFPRGGRFIPVHSSAYATAQASGALVHMDYETLSLLSSIYELQNTLAAQDERISDLLLSPEHIQPGNFYYMLAVAPGLMQDVVNSEARLRELYDRFLAGD